MDLLSFVVFVLIFAGMVLVHEFGHFIAARLVNVEVEEFGFGMPPKIMTLFKWRGTDFTLNAIPFGGFVRPKGENDPAIPDGLAAAVPWKRFVVLSAGPAMNLILGVGVCALLVFLTGIPQRNMVMIGEVFADRPAEAAGIQQNDIVLEFNDVVITDILQMQTLIRAQVGQPTAVRVLRGKTELNLTVTPIQPEDMEYPVIGVILTNPTNPVTIPQALGYGLRGTGEYIYALVTLPAKIVSGQVSGEEGRLIGLKGLYDIVDRGVQNDIATRQSSPATTGSPRPAPSYYTLETLLMLTISLGVFNLFPIPALDGGRIIFLLPELLFRRRVPYQLENAIHGVSFLLLLGLMIYVNVMDFVKPIVLP